MGVPSGDPALTRRPHRRSPQLRLRRRRRPPRRGGLSRWQTGRRSARPSDRLPLATLAPTFAVPRPPSGSRRRGTAHREGECPARAAVWCRRAQAWVHAPAGGWSLHGPDPQIRGRRCCPRSFHVTGVGPRSSIRYEDQDATGGAGRVGAQRRSGRHVGRSGSGWLVPVLSLAGPAMADRARTLQRAPISRHRGLYLGLVVHLIRRDPPAEPWNLTQYSCVGVQPSLLPRSQWGEPGRRR